jgi:prepilin-type N-terminal cleavage/methylation domain-containing protein
MESPELRAARPVPDRRGFTLVELLVALLISGLLAIIIFQLLQGQGRFVAIQGAREEVQQNARAVVELVGGELRGVPGGGLIQGTEDSLTIRVPRVWGVLCAAPGGGATTLQVSFPANGPDLTPTDSTGLAVQIGTGAGATWTNGVRITAVGPRQTTCGSTTLAAGAEARTLTFTGSLGGTAPDAGAPVYVYDPVTYRTGTSDGMDGLWIQRRSGGNGSQPFAGPITEGTSADSKGLRFAYFDENGATLATPLSAADRARVRGIRLVVHTLSTRGVGDHASQEQTDSIDIFLRNRVGP